MNTRRGEVLKMGYFENKHSRIYPTVLYEGLAMSQGMRYSFFAEYKRRDNLPLSYYIFRDP